LGTNIGANTVFAIKLRDRLIDHETMTKGFEQHIANKAQVPLDVLKAHFARPPVTQSFVHYKADEKPAAANKQSFEEAVRSSSLTPEQQKFLLGL